MRRKIKLLAALLFVGVASVLLLAQSSSSNKHQPPSAQARSRIKQMYSLGRPIPLKGEVPGDGALDGPITYSAYYTLAHSSLGRSLLSSNKGLRLLVVLHGCSRTALNWFELPEERSILRVALGNNLFDAVLAVESTDTESHCWNGSPFFDTDTPSIASAIEALAGRLCGSGSDAARCFAGGVTVLGSSSGGTMASTLLRTLPGLRGAVVMISPGNEDALLQHSKTKGAGRVAFVYMGGDTSFATGSGIDATVAKMNANTAGIARAWRCTDKTMRADTLHERIEDFPLAASRKFYQVMVARRLVDTQTDTVLLNKDWNVHQEARDILEECVRKMPLFPWSTHAAAIEEVLKVVQNVHETTSEHAEEVLRWVTNQSQSESLL